MDRLESQIEKLAWAQDGLLPCIAQDVETREVLMLAYTNKEALQLTLNTKRAHYFSRSKQRIWQKGEQSGQIQEVQHIWLDCDNDSILLEVRQIGQACHTGEKSCFFTPLSQESKAPHTPSPNDKPLQYSLQHYDILDTLYHVLQSRKNADSQSSYTASLFGKGENAIAKKIIEEAGEFCFALKDKGSKEIIYECADVLYHILVGLASVNIHPDRVYQELQRRMGISGIDEKNARAQAHTKGER